MTTHNHCPKCWTCPDCDARWCVEWCDYSHLCGQDDLDETADEPNMTARVKTVAAAIQNAVIARSNGAADRIKLRTTDYSEDGYVLIERISMRLPDNWWVCEWEPSMSVRSAVELLEAAGLEADSDFDFDVDIGTVAGIRIWLADE